MSHATLWYVLELHTLPQKKKFQGNFYFTLVIKTTLDCNFSEKYYDFFLYIPETEKKKFKISLLFIADASIK